VNQKSPFIEMAKGLFFEHFPGYYHSRPVILPVSRHMIDTGRQKTDSFIYSLFIP